MADEIIYEGEELIVDQDGVVIQTKNRTVVKKDKSPMFMKVFTKDIGAIKKVSSGASKLLFGLFRFVDRENMIIVNKSRKQIIEKLIGIKPSSQNMYLVELVKKGILIRPNRGEYMLNPYIFGKESWEGIKELRTEVVYNFDTLVKTVEFTQTSNLLEQ